MQKSESGPGFEPTIIAIIVIVWRLSQLSYLTVNENWHLFKLFLLCVRSSSNSSSMQWLQNFQALHIKSRCTAYCMNCLHYSVKAVHIDFNGNAFKIWMYWLKLVKAIHTDENTCRFWMQFLYKLEAIHLDSECNAYRF